MKKINLRRAFLLLTISAIAVLETSCVSAPRTNTDIQDESAVAEKTIKGPKSITVQNTSNQAEKKFKEQLASIELKVVSAPNAKRTVYSKAAFKEPYVVSVTDENGAVADFSVTVSWPVSRTNDTISYSTVQLITDASGKITFLPEPSEIAVKDKISFYPTPVSSSPSVVQVAFSAGTQAPFVVKSSATQYPGGILYVYDFNENGRPTTNNFTLLQNLRNAGINAGNAPVSDTSYLNKTNAEIYNACKDIVGNAANFMIIGTFKYAEPAVENETGATVTLTADITCLNMKDGSTLYKTTITDTATDKNKWSAEQKCRSTLAEKVSDAIIYSM